VRAVAGLAVACLAVSVALGQTLREEVKTEGLPLLIATDQYGLGAEAQALVPWIRAHPGPLKHKSPQLHTSKLFRSA